jgi:hypothetical protein
MSRQIFFATWREVGTGEPTSRQFRKKPLRNNRLYIMATYMSASYMPLMTDVFGAESQPPKPCPNVQKQTGMTARRGGFLLLSRQITILPPGGSIEDRRVEAAAIVLLRLS